MARARCLALSALLLLLAGAAGAQDVGTVAAARGAAEIGRGGAWTPAAVGLGVQLGDELRTGDGTLRVVFQDDSVIDLSEHSALVVDNQVFDPGEGRFASLFKLLDGKARALVGAYYRKAGAVYEVETPTAVAGVRGTSFLISYHRDLDRTEVIGIHGQVEVRGLADRMGEAVYITAQEATTVARDQPPAPPERLDDYRFHREVEGLELIGLGSRAGGLAASHPLRGGGSVPAPEQAPAASSGVGQVGRDELRNTGDVVGQPLGVIEATRGRLGVPF